MGLELAGQEDATSLSLTGYPGSRSPVQGEAPLSLCAGSAVPPQTSRFRPTQVGQSHASGAALPWHLSPPFFLWGGACIPPCGGVL